MEKEEFKQIRIDMGLTQRKFAELLGKNYRTIQRIESGEWPIYKPVQQKLIEILKNK